MLAYTPSPHTVHWLLHSQVETVQVHFNLGNKSEQFKNT